MVVIVPAIGVFLVLVALTIAARSLVTIFIAVAMVAAPPRAMLVVIADDYRLRVVAGSRSVAVTAVATVAAVAGIVIFVAALKREHPDDERGRSDGRNDLA